MDPVRHILEIYGAIDYAIKDSGDPNLLAAADALIPGASKQTGWYETLFRFLFPNEEFEPPTVQNAISTIADDTASAEPLTNAQKVRLLYGLSAVARLKKVSPDSSLPTFDVGIDTEFAGQLQRALAKVAPEPEEFTRSDFSASEVAAEETSSKERGAAVSPEQLQSFLDGVSADFLSRKDFDSKVRDLAATTLRSGTALTEPLCDTSIVTIDGSQCVMIDTQFEADDVSLEDLKKIVNPYNWSTDYPKFFLEMRMQPKPRILSDGWRRVREKVRVVEGFNLLTPLKYFPYEDPKRPLEASLEYDLDESALGTGDRKVTVDRGYIRMWSTDPADPAADGVKVATRKIVHITGIPPWVQAQLVCMCGYGTSSADFLLKAARKNPQGTKLFPFFTSEAEADDTSVPPPPPPPPSTPSPIHFVPAAVEVWTETVGDLTNSYLHLAEKWMTGGVTYADVADHCRRVGGDLASAPWNYLRAMTTPRPPGGTRGDQ